MVVLGAEREAITAGRLIALVFVLLIAAVAGSLWLLFGNLQQARLELIRTYEQIIIARDLFTIVEDAETGKRGYLLTRDPAYIENYERAIERVQPLLDKLSKAPSPPIEASITNLRTLVEKKLDELAAVLRLAEEGRFEDALDIIRSGEGQQLKDDIRRMVVTIDQGSRELLAERFATVQRAARDQLLGSVLIVLALCGILVIAGFLLRRAFRSMRDAERRADANAEQLRISLDSLSQGISVFDAEFRLVSWNYCFVELFSVPERLLQVGTPYSAFVRHDWTDDEGDFLETPAQVAAAPPEHMTRSAPVVYERTRADGRTFELRRTPLPSGGFVITYTDISHRLEAERKLRQAQQLDAIGQLTGGVAHDFNNLLTVILGNVESLKRKIRDPEQMRVIDMVLAAAERGASLTRQLLAFARRQPLEPRPLDVNRLIADMDSFLQRSLGEQIKVETVISPGLWTVLADASQLQNAILNLALNARDAMADGGVLTIEAANATLDAAYARAHAEVQPGSYVMIAITDTGCGMSPEVVARAFEPFFSTKGQDKGSGLGLSQVFGFVKQSGGHVKIYSELGSGTTVKLYLPRTTQPAVQIARPPEEIVQGRETVLIVEDDTAVRRTAVAMLSDLGYRCAEAPDANQALEFLATSNVAVDLLFTDVILPGGMLGREFAARARALKPGLGVLFTSGYTRNAIVHNGRIDDDVLFVSKPYKKSELAAKLRQALDSAAAEAKPAPSTADPAAARGRMIVVVEDEPLVLWLAVDLCRELGYKPVEARNAAEALTLFDDGGQNIDGMITDLGLPDMPGDELAVRVRKRRPDLPIIVTTGHGAESLGVLAELGRVAFVAKPYDMAALRAALENLGLSPSKPA
jgi:signal transduction histidine kinase/CHASE3 domain sensor protein/DNA-binding response OmpR family regulator